MGHLMIDFAGIISWRALGGAYFGETWHHRNISSSYDLFEAYRKNHGYFFILNESFVPGLSSKKKLVDYIRKRLCDFKAEAILPIKQ